MASSPDLESWHHFFFRVFGPRVCMVLDSEKVDSASLERVCPPEVEWFLEDGSSRYSLPGKAIFRLTSKKTRKSLVFDGDKKIRAPVGSDVVLSAPCPCSGDGFCYVWAMFLVYTVVYLHSTGVRYRSLIEIARNSVVLEDDLYRTFLSSLGSNRLEVETLFDRHRIELKSSGKICLEPTKESH